MRRRISSLIAGVIAIVPGASHAQEAKQAPAQAAMQALADFGIAYSYWTMEARCRLLSEDQRAEFAEMISADVAALSAVFPPETVAAVAGSGVQMANDPRYEGCFAGDVQFGRTLSREVAHALKALPRGFKLDVKP